MPDFTRQQITERAQLVSTFEAACALDFGGPQAAELRLDLMQKIGSLFHLKDRARRAPGPLSADELRERGWLIRVFKSATRIFERPPLLVRFLDSVAWKLRDSFGLLPMEPPAARPKCPHN